MHSYYRSFALAGVVLALSGAALAQSSSSMSSASSPFSGLFGGQTEEKPVAVTFSVANDAGEIAKALKNASLVTAALREDRFTGQDILAAARSDYARLLSLLYDRGYYSSVINIRLDGVEAAEIAPLDAPEVVNTVQVTVEPGPQFEFSRAALGPRAPGTAASDEYAVGQPAGTGVIKSEALGAVDGWRNQGHAKADVSGQQIIANHNLNTVDSQVELAPGPLVTFGALQIKGYDRMTPRRLRKIAGYPEGEQFDPELIETVHKRLRRTGVFSATILDEAEVLNPDNSMDYLLTVVEQKPRRVGAGFEISNTDGAMVSAYWMHRNLLGGAERLRFDGEVSDIGSDTSGRDIEVTARLDRPATITPDTTAFVESKLQSEKDEEYDLEGFEFGVGFNHIFRDEDADKLTADFRLKYESTRVTDANGRTDFEVISFPMSAIWDKRDDSNNAKRGFYLSGELTPFYGLQETGSGARALAEGRGYYSFGAEDKFTLAGRARLGTVEGADISQTPRDYLFYSGGGGTVRGQPYESLGVRAIAGPGGPIKTGGMSVASLNAELRWQLREKIGVVFFADFGQVWADSTFSGGSGAHSGAGAGIRYDTPIGPLRFDVAAPVSGETGSGVQFYLGLGQAF